MAGPKPINPVVAIVGATGTGKSQVRAFHRHAPHPYAAHHRRQLAVDLALKFNGEIINADAMQLYDGLPIITNKIPLDEQKGVPHHLLGCVSLNDQPWRADKFVKNALDIIADIRARGRIPIVVGGTHYYTQSLLFKNTLIDTDDHDISGDIQCAEISTGPTKWPILEESTETMLAKLREVDPVMASRWHPNDARKIRRSLQIWLQSGKKASELYEEQEKQRQLYADLSITHKTEPEDGLVDTLEEASAGLRFPSLIFWVNVPREAAAGRLDARVDQMMQAGLLKEACELDKYAHDLEQAGIPVGRTRGIYAAVGYKEFQALLEVLHIGTTDKAQLEKLKQDGVEMTKIATRRYAKTQLRWIRIKLMNALQRANATKSIVLLDASSVDVWTSTVLDPAVKRMAAFLDGDDTPKDGEEAQPELLSPLRIDLGQRRDLWQQQTCEMCNVTAVTEEDWQKHIQGSRHRRTMRNRQKKDGKQRWPHCAPEPRDDVSE